VQQGPQPLMRVVWRRFGRLPGPAGGVTVWLCAGFRDSNPGARTAPE